MKKNFSLIDERFQEEFMAIFAIGLTQCLKQNLIDTERAEQWLFSPVVAHNLKRKGYDKNFFMPWNMLRNSMPQKGKNSF